MNIQAIETRFDGHLFRSRTEARWAVFFKEMGWKYQYEVEGYDLDGVRYLPDFFLPELDCWFEVKGTTPTAAEIDKLKALVLGTEKSAVGAVGAPKDDEYNLFCILFNNKENKVEWLGLSQCWPVVVRFCFGNSEEGDFGIAVNDSIYIPFSWPKIKGRCGEAYEAASSARFEFGAHA